MPDEKNRTYACPICGFVYRDEETARKCEAYCREHNACSSEITKLAIGHEEKACCGGACGGGCVCSEKEGACACECPPEEKKEEAKPATAEDLAAEYLNNWKRALADYRNLQKEVAKEREEMGQYAVLRVVERFLPVFDNFNVAMEHFPSNVKCQMSNVDQWAVGVGFIQKQIADALADLGLKKIPTVGEKFDPARHEAVGEEDAASCKPQATSHKPQAASFEPGHIVREVQAGYDIGGKVVRPAKVIVAK